MLKNLNIAKMVSIHISDPFKKFARKHIKVPPLFQPGSKDYVIFSHLYGNFAGHCETVSSKRPRATHTRCVLQLINIHEPINNDWQNKHELLFVLCSYSGLCTRKILRQREEEEAEVCRDEVLNDWSR